MGAVYPTTLVSFTTKEDKVDIVYADHVNRLQEEVVALETNIGLNPQGALASLVDRLALLQDTDGSFAKGSSYPTNPVDGQAFYKSDEDGLFIYNGSDWEAVGSSLSSLIFNWSGGLGVIGQSSTDVGIYHQSVVATAGVPDLGAGVNDALFGMDYVAVHTKATYFPMFDFKYRKLQGQNSIALWTQMWSNRGSATNVALCKAEIGGQVATAGVYSGNFGTNWVQGQSIDVSGFDVGSYYNGKIYFQINGGDWGMGCNGVTLIAF